MTGRVFPQVGLVWSYPLIHRGESMTQLIEPIVGGFAAPSSGNRRNIPNEDSLSFQLYDTDLFRRDRLAGYDILDTGQRVDYGAKFGLYDKEGGSYRLLIGQSYRAQPNPFLPPGSGAEKRLSDVVGRLVLSPNSYLDLIYRFRFDTSPLSNRNQQVGISAGPQNLRVSGNFCLSSGATAERGRDQPGTGQNVLYGKREQLSFSAHRKADALLVDAGVRNDQPDEHAPTLVNNVPYAAAVELQPLWILVGDLSGRMHGVYRRGDAIGNTQRRRDTRVFRAVQRRLQELRRDRRHCRLDLRGRACRDFAVRGSIRRRIAVVEFVQA